MHGGFESKIWPLVVFLTILTIILHSLSVESVDSYFLLIQVFLLLLHVSWEFLEERKLTMEGIVELLMASVGILTYSMGLHIEGVLVLGMYGLAEILERLAMRWADSGMRKLMELMPKRARVLRDGSVREVDLDSVTTNDLVVVAGGERVPVDGIVVRGRGTADRSIVTGEPGPVGVEEGSYVDSGTLLLEGSVVIRPLRVGKESFVARMLELVSKYKERKGQGERLISKFSKFYLPSMLILAAASWILIGPRASIVFVAVACPSAFLVSSAAISLTFLSVLSRNGILPKGTRPLEEASKVRVIALDKTGTLTLGRPVVKEIVMDREAFRLLASLELASRHPLAEAVIERARSLGLRLVPPEEVEEVPGKGIRGRVEGRFVEAGRGEFIGVEESGRTEIHVRIDGKYAGNVIFGEEVAPETRQILDLLRKMGMRIAMLTGDRRESAEFIAKSLGISEFYPELTPDEKVRVVKALRSREEKPVAMVGDGINDAPALAAADVGVAVGKLEASMEAGDVAIPSGIGGLPTFFKAARRYATVFWTSATLIGLAKAFAIALGVTGAIPLWTAVALGDDGGLLLTLASIGLAVRDLGWRD